MRTSESTAQLVAALARIQGTIPVVDKNKGVDVPGKEGRPGWKSRYATIDKLFDVARPALAAEGIAIIQTGGFSKDGGGERLFTRLARGDEWIEGDFPVKASREGAQGYGGGMSFARRWGVVCMVGLVAVGDEDERAGYQDNRPAKPQRAKVAAGLSERVAGIRDAADADELTRRAIEARSVHPLPEEATAVERAVAAWFVGTFGEVRSLDDLTLLRDACNKVKPRGNDVREAIRAAEARLTNGNA